MITAHFKNSITFWGISFCFLILSLNVYSQEGIQQRFFTSENGLKISWVNSITKSPNNDITIVHSPKFYFAKYDGTNFDYTISPSGILGKTYEDFLGNYWSIGKGNLDNVNFYSNDSWQDLEFEVGIPFMPTPGIGNKLLFLSDGALKEYDKAIQQTRIVKRSEVSQIGRLIDMTTFQDGSVWITGEYGVAKYLVQADDSKEQWVDFQVPKALGLYHFNKPFEGENGELTFMSKSSKSKQNVLAGFDGKEWQKLYASQTDEVYSGWRGHDNSLWIIKGRLPPMNGPIKVWNLFHVQQGQETLVKKNRILNRILNDIVVEPNGNFWLATGSGLAYFTPSLWRNQTIKRDLNQQIRKIHEDLSGRLWFAMEDAFSLFSDDKWESHQCNPAVYTGDICSLKNGLLVVGTTDSGGLALYNPVEKSCTVTFPFGNEKVRYYDQDKNGNCFIILQDLNETSHLIRYDGEHIEILAEDLNINKLAPGECEVTDIIQTSSGDIWIVTYTDIIVYKKGIRKSYDLKEEFDWGISTSILELGNGKIWIGGNNGILQYDGENWSLIQTPEFETARKIIIARDSSIWVASGTGIHRFINGTWISNSTEEGLPDAVIFDILGDKQGKIWAVSENGIFCYYPEADTDAPETVVPSNMNFHKAIPSGEVQFMFEGHDKWDYTQDDRLKYSYRFDNNSWSPFESRTIAKRVGLSTGAHIFEVRAMDRNGNIDPSPASWPFTVLLPWYLQTYFIIISIIAIFIIILLLGFAITRHFRVEKLVLTRTAELEKTKEKVEKSELELQSKNEEYEVINEELNETNKNLYKAKDKAEESDRLKSAFLANMSHEIRTPMNGILGFAELLKEPGLTGKQQQQYISIIEKGGARMLNIINNIVSISKIESGQEEIYLQESNINEQIEFIYTFFKPEIEGKGMQFSFKNSLPSKKSIIKTDRVKINAILTNIVKNAIKYTEKGSIEFGYSKKDKFLEFFVKDTGIGIPKDRQEAIFERFIQADIADKNAYQGAGLGLSISKAYVEMLDGKIWVESEERMGSTFYFTLPYSYEKIKEKNVKNEVLTHYEVTPVKKLKILIVEDDETSGMFISIAIQEFANEIISVITGTEAVDACRNNPDIDVVMMDIQLPEMNGYEATKQIRKFNKDVIIIAQTAFALEGDREKAIAAGCDDYISKPINREELFEKIENNLRKK